MSPEVVKIQNYTENIDIWGLGILLYEMVHGYSPFDGKTYHEILNNIMNKEISFIFIIIVYDKNINPDLRHLLS